MPDLLSVNLRAEATAEAGRLTNARAVLRDADHRALAELEGDTTWIALARPRARQQLETRVYLIWRVALEDEAGRLVESRLVPVAIEIASAEWGHSSSRSILSAL